MKAALCRATQQWIDGLARSRHFVASIFILSGMGLALAGPADAIPRRLGVMAGVNYSTILYDEELPFWDVGWRASFSAGAELELWPAGPVSFMTGLRYLRQGNRVTFDTGLSGGYRNEGSFRIIQDYVSIPVLAHVRPGRGRRLGISLGPEVSLLVSGKLPSVMHTSGLVNETLRLNEDITDDLDFVNVLATAGVDYEIPWDRRTAVIQSRYTYGVTGAAKEDHWLADWHTEGLELLFGVRW